jgi:hypothetical protein
MKRLLHCCFLQAAIICSGCAIFTPPPTTVNYGPYPDGYRAIIADYMTPFLHDPASATYQNWRGPAQGFLTTGSGIVYGYRVCAELEFRNKLGFYGGNRNYLFMISNNRVIVHEGGHKQGSVEAEMLSRICRLDK